MNNFFIKVVRNGLILSGLFFVSLWAGLDFLDFAAMKSLMIFFISYCLAELARYYKLSSPYVSTTKKRKCPINTLVF